MNNPYARSLSIRYPPPILCAVILWASLLILASPDAAAQSGYSLVEIPEITVSERVGLEQIEQSILAQQFDAATGQLIDLAASSSGRLILAPDGWEHGFERWIPMESFLHDRLFRWSATSPELLQHYRRRVDPLASAAVQHARQSQDITAAIESSVRFLASSHGDDALKLVADLAYERQWTGLARSALSRIDRRLQICAVGPTQGAPVPSVPWDYLLREHPKHIEAIAGLLKQRSGGLPLLTCGDTRLALDELAAYFAAYSLQQHDPLRADREIKFAQQQFPGSLDTPLAQTVLARIEREPSKTKSRPDKTLNFAHLPAWTRPLQGKRGTQDDVRFFPTVWENRVLVHDINRIVGFHLQSGNPWPELPSDSDAKSDGELPSDGDAKSDGQTVAAAIYEDQHTREQCLPPSNLPATGAAVFSLNQAHGRLVARLGPAVTRWLPVLRRSSNPSGVSRSSVALMQLDSEGRLLDAYPQTLTHESLRDYEIEATPVIDGDCLYFGVTGVQGTLETSRVVCMDVRSAELLWISQSLSSGAMLMDRSASRVTHCRVLLHQGTLYYQSGLGCVTALDPATGAVRWLLRYPRGFGRDNPYRQDHRLPASDGGGMLVDDQQLFVSAMDCERLFSIDFQTGQLLWVSPPELAADARFLIGVTPTHLIASGNRLYWINRRSGSIDAAFSTDSSRRAIDGVAGPRSAGVGLVYQERIYWPTSSDIMIFDANLHPETSSSRVRMVDRIELSPLALSGGNLMIAREHLILASPAALAVFRPTD